MTSTVLPASRRDSAPCTFVSFSTSSEAVASSSRTIGAFFKSARAIEITSNYVYHNIPSRDRQKILLETLRVLKKGGTFALHDIFSKAKYGNMQLFVDKLREMGYEKVELIDTTDGRFMSPAEAKWMALSGSALLVGRK